MKSPIRKNFCNPAAAKLILAVIGAVARCCSVYGVQINGVGGQELAFDVELLEGNRFLPGSWCAHRQALGTRPPVAGAQDRERQAQPGLCPGPGTQVLVNNIASCIRPHRQKSAARRSEAAGSPTSPQWPEWPARNPDPVVPSTDRGIEGTGAHHCRSQRAPAAPGRNPPEASRRAQTAARN